MKKTIILLCIAVGLGIFTYFFEELRGVKKVEAEKTAQALFDQSKLGEFVGLKLPRATLQKIGGRFHVLETNQLVDESKLQEVLDILGHLQVKRVLSENDLKVVGRQEFFPSEKDRFVFLFEKGEVPVLFGKKVEHDQSFYVEVKTPTGVKTVLAFDSSPQLTPLTQEDYRLNPYKYGRILSIVWLTPGFFNDTFIFREWKHQHGPETFSKIEVKNIRNVPLTIDLLNKSLTPRPPAQIAYLENAFSDYAKALFNMQAGQLWAPQDLGKLSEQVATLSITTTTGKIFVLQLFKKATGTDHKVRSGQFVKVSDEELVFEISSTSAKLLFSSSQDFLEKRIYKNMGADGLSLQGDKEEPFTVSFSNGASAKLIIPKGEDFEVRASDPALSLRPLNNSFSQLFSFLFTPGERVSVMDKDDFKLVPKAFMNIDYKGRVIHLVFQDREILVLNPSSGIKINYYVGNGPAIGTEASDYFDTRVGNLK